MDKHAEMFRCSNENLFEIKICPLKPEKLQLIDCLAWTSLPQAAETLQKKCEDQDE